MSSRNQASDSTQLCVTRVFFLSLLSRNFDDQLSSNFHRFVVSCICLDTPSEKTGLWQLPTVSRVFKQGSNDTYMYNIVQTSLFMLLDRALHTHVWCFSTSILKDEFICIYLLGLKLGIQIGSVVSYLPCTSLNCRVRAPAQYCERMSEHSIACGSLSTTGVNSEKGPSKSFPGDIANEAFTGRQDFTKNSNIFVLNT